MAASSGSLHEDPAVLASATVERHRAIVSLMEELEAIDWYDQRVDASGDDELRAVLAHNRDEEKEHAVMTLEWLRRHDPVLDEQLRTYLFADAPILEVEKEAEGVGDAGGTGPSDAAGTDTSLGIGSLKGSPSL